MHRTKIFFRSRRTLPTGNGIGPRRQAGTRSGVGPPVPM